MPAWGVEGLFTVSCCFAQVSGNCVIYVHSEGRNGLDTVCSHSIFFLAQTLLSRCAPIGLFGTDIHLSEYGSGYLRGKKRKKKKKKNCSYKMFDRELNTRLLQVFRKNLGGHHKRKCNRYMLIGFQKIFCIYLNCFQV